QRLPPAGSASRRSRHGVEKRRQWRRKRRQSRRRRRRWSRVPARPAPGPAAEPTGLVRRLLRHQKPGPVSSIRSSGSYVGPVGASRPAGQDAPTADGLHQSAAAGTRAAVQAQQIPVQTEAVRGGHQPDAHRDAGEDLVPEQAHEVEAVSAGSSRAAAAAATVAPAGRLLPGVPVQRGRRH
uniref:Serine/arginine repetitive matrix protein 2 n=1 Tax=Macrostomum lignano TaxID=282301 RepID=A0A1I8FXX7_9PLAT